MAVSYKTEAIILKRLNYSEADKIITIFTKHYGKIKCLAKGIRRLTSRKRGNLELFNLTRLFLIKGRNLDLVTEVQVINNFLDFRKNLKKVAAAYQLIELVDRITRENQANKQIFDLLKFSLTSLNNGEGENQIVMKAFKINLLKYTGFGLPLTLEEKFLDYHLENIIERKVKYFYV